MIGSLTLVRRVLLLASVFYAVSLFAGISFASDDLNGVKVSVRAEENGFYTVDGRFAVDALSNEVWNVLSDYNNIGSFVSTMKSSRIITREANSVLIEQVSQNNILFISQEIKVRLKVVEYKNNKLSFEDLALGNFEYYKGSWEISGTGKNTELNYNLKVKPKLGVLGFFTGNLVRGQIEGQIKNLLAQVKTEILNREMKAMDKNETK